jgi:3-oxoacyl-[acyl-carrier protein] reductase
LNINELKAIVTGAASGIGRCMALELVRGGAAVMGGDIDEDGLLEWQHEAKGLPGRAIPLVVDVSREDAANAFVKDAVDKLDGVNLLVNNAGTLRDGLLATLEDGWVRKLPTAQWRAVIETNLTGPYLVSREVAAAMLERQIRPGLIVNISSVTREGNPGQSNYAASKAGLDALTRTWGLELAKHGIRVGGIAPGLTDTPMLATMDAQHRRDLIAKLPLGQVGRPYDIWLALRFIIECEFFNARVVDVDGGMAF